MDTTKQINRLQFKELAIADDMGSQKNNSNFSAFPYKTNVIQSIGDNILSQLSKEQPKEKEPPISAEDIAHARQKAFEDGYTKGYTSAKSSEAETEKAIQTTLSEVVLKLNTLNDTVRTTNNKHIKELNDLVLMIARKVAGRAIKEDPYTTIEEVIGNALPLMFDEPKVTIYVNPGLVKGIETRLTSLIKKENFKNDIEILGNDALTYGSCQLEWNRGGIKSSKDEMWQKIEALLESL